MTPRQMHLFVMSKRVSLSTILYDFVPFKRLNNNKVSTCPKRTTFQLCAVLHFGEEAAAKWQLTTKSALESKTIFSLLFSFSFLIVGLN